MFELHVDLFISLCTENSVCQLGALRLVGGSTNLDGRVEVCLGNRWGTVCGYYWDTPEANVVCRQQLVTLELVCML